MILGIDLMDVFGEVDFMSIREIEDIDCKLNLDDDMI